jgi:hypothetical protein
VLVVPLTYFLSEYVDDLFRLIGGEIADRADQGDYNPGDTK